MIQVNQNDTVRVHATNGLGDQPTALHTHGVHFNNTGYYDGPIGTTQCGIPPGETLVYEIPVDLQYGTYWIHVSRCELSSLGVGLMLFIAGSQTRPICRWSSST